MSVINIKKSFEEGKNSCFLCYNLLVDSKNGDPNLVMPVDSMTILYATYMEMSQNADRRTIEEVHADAVLTIFDQVEENFIIREVFIT